ncbi:MULTISPECIES: GntR family transcriptional regulator [unclassified Haematobacter]|uniref:GntR family transcriptional regulator n=1 Tax=unclassified Haematobacter TaxID=2640585 RepID=UPI0025BE404C|nr:MULTISPECIES: GntR family transcriptional regulator [unclassified Haematobacter]
MEPFPPDRRTDKVRRTLEEMIVEGFFADGERLDEVKLAEQLEVSRTPLREAFQSLAASGLLELRPRRGTFVRFPALDEIVEMFDVMAEIEALCGRYAARRMTDTELKDVQAALVECENAVHRNDLDDYYRANQTFHQLIYHASGNRFLAAEAERLHRRLKPFRRLQLRVRGRLAESLREHRLIVAALADGDEARVTRVMRDHIAVQGARFNDLAVGYRTAIRGRQNPSQRHLPAGTGPEG